MLLSQKPLALLKKFVGIDAHGNVRLSPRFSTAVTVAEILVPADIETFTTTGYYTEGDGGAVTYRRSPSAAHLRSKDGSHWAVVTSQPSVRMFGARGDGSDDTLALEQAHEYCVSSYIPPLDRSSRWRGTQLTLTYPPGHYVYNGTGIRIKGGPVAICGYPNAVTLEIRSDVYLLTYDGFVGGSYVFGLNVVGGRGFIKYSHQGHNVGGMHVFLDCSFDAYTECAIGNNSNDHPYLKVSRCQFRGSKDCSTIGIAWGGYIDCLLIEDCAFLCNAYHIKIGPRLSGAISICRNDFIQFSAGVRKADIWIVPNSSDDHGRNAGIGLLIIHNKFGNENLLPEDTRIIIAAEQQTPEGDRLSRAHSTTWIDDGSYLQGIAIERNRIDGIADLRSSFITSYINQLWRLEFRSNFINGGSYRYMCEFKGAVSEPLFQREGGRWEVHLGPQKLGGRPFAVDVSNRASALSLDVFGTMQGSESVLLHPPGGDDSGFQLLFRMGLAEIRTVNGVSEQTPDRLGGQNGLRILAVDSGFAPEVGAILSNVKPGAMAWVEVDLCGGRSVLTQAVSLEVRHYDSRLSSCYQVIRLSDNWRTARIPFLFPSDAQAEGWRVRISALASESATSSSDMEFCVGRLCVYHARQAVNAGHVATIGSGTWDGEHIVLGTFHIWVDQEDQLRVKRGKPTSDSDGKVVGR